MLDSLPPYLRERSRVHDDREFGAPKRSGYVLYWMRSALRVDENPALDVARLVAAQEGLPLLIYQAISEHYLYASDRHHTFMIEGARDVQQQCHDKGLQFAFHLAHRHDRGHHLITLANEASVVVTEDMPVDPPRRFLAALARKSPTPVICVDTACVVPMQLVGKPYTRAFQYRSATKARYAERVTRTWPELDLKTPAFDSARLPFQPLDLANQVIRDLVARCAIDHAVGPVTDTPGGSAAGYQRWSAFRDHQLASYAKHRNNALLDGVSRMSPYLHYGMVSPMRIAREAAAIDNPGSEKYLDELLIWREMAYAFCFYRNDHDQYTAIPDWARRTLDDHLRDSRPEIYSWEQLARGQTVEELWNIAQKSLLMRGELHNNVRMTWGKAILQWKATPQEALAAIIDLNHRYALDGRDPASYGGILWCLGQFDRPFEPEQNIIGTVRPRPVAVHAARLDPEKYGVKVMQPLQESQPAVAVIGAGISGLFAARTLQDHGFQVTVFEKSRGVGGRMATRRVEGGMAFDHGAQYFTARDPGFIRYVQSWREQGLVATWPNQKDGPDQRIVVLRGGRIESESNTQQRFVAMPYMNSICKHLSQELSIHKQTRIAEVRSDEHGVHLTDDAGNNCGAFQRLIVSTPAEQAAELLKNYRQLAQSISQIEMNPCWAAMVAFDHSLTRDWAGAFLHDSFLAWAARNSTKRQRIQETEMLVLHAGPEWTAENWEQDADKVATRMLKEFWRVSGIEPRTPIHLQTHRWKYAIPGNPSDRLCFQGTDPRIIACGDWASGSRVEGAFLSGMAAAGRILSAADA